MFQDPSHSKASGLDTYNIYGCLQHLAEASHRDWWVGSACGTPFVPLSRGRLLSLAVDSIFGDWDISFRDLQGKENAAVHPKIAFLVVATFLNPIQSVYIYIYIVSTSNWENHGDLLDSHGAFLDLGLQGPAVPLSFRLIFPNRLLSMPVTPGASPSCG